MPLKIFHYMLIDPSIAIVGLSNWTLDSSKMNRAICLQRPEPSDADILLTSENIMKTTSESTEEAPAATTVLAPLPETLKKRTSKPKKGSAAVSVPTPITPTTQAVSSKWLQQLGRMYLYIYTHQKELLQTSRDYIGMRDYYSMLKYIKNKVTSSGDLSHIPTVTLVNAIARNFGGHTNSIPVLLPLFYEACFSDSKDMSQIALETTVKSDKSYMTYLPPTTELIRDNLHESENIRNLMILSKNANVINVIFGCALVDATPGSVRCLVGSRFKDDLEEMHLIQQINLVRQAMAEGKTCILVNNENIYESLYDVLNQRYITQRDKETGESKRFLRLAIGSRSQLCIVETGFKLIVVVEQAKAYESLDLPLLNRFEKQILSPMDVLATSSLAVKLLSKLQQWCQLLHQETGLPSLAVIFVGFYEDTLSSLVLSLTNFCQVCATLTLLYLFIVGYYN